MKTFYLLRHANTQAASPPLHGDHERILTPQGTDEAIAVGHFMQENNYYPDYVMCSSAVRTIQTTRLLFGVLFTQVGLNVSSHFDRTLYLASASQLLSHIHAADDGINQLLLVAHNPGIAELAAHFGDVPNYAPATLTVFKADVDKWADVYPEVTKMEKIFVPAVKAA